MSGTAASKARCFCVLFLVHLVQILLRTATLSLLAATHGWLAAVYLVGDFVVLVGYKSVRRDVVYWPPKFGVPFSLLSRFLVKVFTDSTSCVQFRNPLDLGGLYYCLNIFLGQALSPSFSAWPGGQARALRPRSDPFCRAGRGVRVGRAVCGLLRRRGEARGGHALRLRQHAHGGVMYIASILENQPHRKWRDTSYGAPSSSPPERRGSSSDGAMIQRQARWGQIMRRNLV